MSLGVVRLKPGKERKVRNFYPWIQRGECRADGVEDGALARLVDENGEFLAVGTYNARSRFQFRVLDTRDVPIDDAWFRARFTAAEALRRSVVTDTDSWRSLYAEADGVPGLIVDRYGDRAVVQVRSLGMDRLKSVWLPALVETLDVRGVYEKSEMAGREEEGLGAYAGVLTGQVDEVLEMHESGLRFRVPVAHGLKTGFYLDQRKSRRHLGARIRPGDKVLDAFCYSGGFALYAARTGAQAIGVDSSEVAIETARENAALNGLEAIFVEANVFEYLEQDAMGPYDWIVLDPPAIAKTSDKRDSLKWAVWKLVHRALPILKPGGRLIVGACTYQLGLQELVETCRLAGSDRGRRIFLEEVTIQDVDHPALAQFPESLYLKNAWLRAE